MTRDDFPNADDRLRWGWVRLSEGHVDAVEQFVEGRREKEKGREFGE